MSDKIQKHAKMNLAYFISSFLEKFPLWNSVTLILRWNQAVSLQ